MDMQINNLIDWEQRRYELAKSAMQGFCSNPSHSEQMDAIMGLWSINLADEMIKQLKETSNGK